MVVQKGKSWAEKKAESMVECSVVLKAASMVA